MNDPGDGQRRHFADAVDVRPLDVNDIASVRRLQISSFLALAASDLSDEEAIAYQSMVVSPAYMHERFRATERGELLGALHDGRLIGSIEWQHAPNATNLAQIRGPSVDPLFTNCGIGARLLQDTERDIARCALAQIAVRSTMSAIGFFERFGYRITAHGQRQFSPSQAISVALMRKTLADAQPVDPETASSQKDRTLTAPSWSRR
jgi:ribosomal protein S18 acetylase RimI-like enzyme